MHNPYPELKESFVMWRWYMTYPRPKNKAVKWAFWTSLSFPIDSDGTTK